MTHKPDPRLFLALAVAIVAAWPAGAALAASHPYPWPVKPFHTQHPIRGYPGDPRTVFARAATANPFYGPGVFGFHQGIDIVAPNGTPVYPVTNGVAHYLGASTLVVYSAGQRKFQYFHITPVVGEGERVVQSETVLGYVQPPFGHVHLSEIDGLRTVDPLMRGHLTPYRDTTKPAIGALVLTSRTGATESPLGVCGRVQISVTAWDKPALPVPGSFAGLPVAPAYVGWSLATSSGKRLRPWTTVADFRRRIPANRRFWKVYARGTFENAPRFARLQFTGRAGRYLFLLDPEIDTTHMRDGTYVARIRAMDERGNEANARLMFKVRNSGGICRGSLASLAAPQP